MPSKRYRVPREESAFDIWLTNLNINLPSVADRLNETASVGRIAQDASACHYLLVRNEAIRAYKQQESELKERALKGESSGGDRLTLPALNLPEPPDGLIVNAGMWDFANRLVQRIIKADGFTPEIEALLDIGLKGDDSIATEEMKPVIKIAEPLNGAVKIRASLQGMKSYRVFCHRGAGDLFEPIGDSSQSEFFDERPNLVAGQPETRQYKLIFLENNKPVGEFSAIETVVTKP